MRKKRLLRLYYLAQLMVWVGWLGHQLMTARLTHFSLTPRRILLYTLLSTLFVVFMDIFKRLYPYVSKKTGRFGWIIACLFVLSVSFILAAVSRVYSSLYLGNMASVLSVQTLVLALNLTIQTGGWVLVYLTLVNTYQLLLKQRISQKNKLTQTLLEVSLITQLYRPHFLFNALNAIRSLVIVNKEKAKLSIENLKLLLVGYLNTTSFQLVFLSDEIKMLQAYLYMQKVRFGDSFTFNISNNEVPNFKLPKGVLLSMAENAVKHNKRFSDTILIDVNINIEKSEEYPLLVIAFTNNGKLKQDTKSTGIGIRGITGLMTYFYQRKFSYLLFDIPPSKVISILCVELRTI